MFTGIPCIYTEISRDVTTQILCVLIGQGSLTRPMICLRCRSAYLRMFFTAIVDMVSEAFKPRVKGNIYYCKILYRYYDRFGLKSKTSVSFPQFQTLIVVVS